MYPQENRVAEQIVYIMADEASETRPRSDETLPQVPLTESESISDGAAYEMGPELEDEAETEAKQATVDDNADDGSIGTESEVDLPLPADDEDDNDNNEDDNNDDDGSRSPIVDEATTLVDTKDVVNEEKKDKYIQPIEDPFEKATRYLSKHDILPLFQVSRL